MFQCVLYSKSMLLSIILCNLTNVKGYCPHFRGEEIETLRDEERKKEKENLFKGERGMKGQKQESNPEL